MQPYLNKNYVQQLHTYQLVDWLLPLVHQATKQTGKPSKLLPMLTINQQFNHI